MDGRRVGITISDADPRDVLAFDLVDILKFVEDDPAATWTISGVDATGVTAEALHRASDDGTPLDTAQLRELAAGLNQTIDGEFACRRSGAADPWLVIRAVDSSAFDVISDDSDLLEALRRHFHHVRDLPPDGG